MNKAQKNLVSPVISVLCGALLTGCGARSELVDGAPLGPQSTNPSSCASASEPFAKRFGDGNWQVAGSIAVDPNGHPVIAGALSGSLDLGFTTLTAPIIDPLMDAPFPTPPLILEGGFFVARLAPEGCAPFARSFDTLKTRDASIHVALDGDSAVLLTASYSGVVDFGGGPLGPNDGRLSGAVVKLDAGGAHAWSHVFHADQLALNRPAADAQGNVFVAGAFAGELDFDGIATGTFSDIGIDGFVAKLDPSGALLWWKVLRLRSQALSLTTMAVATWADGSVAVAGQTAPSEAVTLELGGVPTATDHQTGFVTSFDAAGEPRWQTLISPLAADAQRAPSGDLVVLGVWDGNGFPIQRFDSTGATSDPVVIAAPSATPSLSVGADDELLIAGALFAPSAGPFAAAVDASGEVLWTRTFDTDHEDGNFRVTGALGPSGTPWLAGGFMGSMDLGSGAISAEGKWPDVFVAALEP